MSQWSVRKASGGLLSTISGGCAGLGEDAGGSLIKIDV